MADKKITDPTIPLATNIADNDVSHIVDVSDTTDGIDGTSKRTLFSLIKTTIKDWILGLNNTFTNTNTFQILGLNPIPSLASLTDRGGFYYRGLRKFTLTTFESLALKVATFDLSSITNEKVYTFQDKDGTIAHLDDITNGGSYYVDFNGYIGLISDDNWYTRNIGPQNKWWDSSLFDTSIGLTPTSFDPRIVSKILPFNCNLTDASVSINRHNSGGGDIINIKAYAFERDSTTVAKNIREVFDLTWDASAEPLNLIKDTDYTIDANENLNKGDSFAFIVSQEAGGTNVALNISINFEFTKI